MSYNVLPRFPGELTERYISELEDSIRVFTVTLSPAQVSANTSAEESFTVTGLRSNDHVFISGPAQTAGIVIGNARASARDTISITFGNCSGSPATPTSGSYNIIAFRGQ
jgi:hypothetical protein